MRKKKIKFKKKFKTKIILFLLTILSLYSVFILLKTNNYKGYSNTEQSIEYKYILVNKNNGLKKDYVPGNLVKVEKCSDGDFFLNEEASIAYEEMCVESINNNLNISIASAYRSYEEQKNLYNNYLKSNGKNYVDTSLVFNSKEMKIRDCDIIIPNMNKHFQFLFHKESMFLEVDGNLQMAFDMKNNVHLISKESYELFSQAPS